MKSFYQIQVRNLLKCQAKLIELTLWTYMKILNFQSLGIAVAENNLGLEHFS